MNVENIPANQASSIDFNFSLIASHASIADSNHQAYKIVISLDNPFDCIVENQVLFGLRGLLIKDGVTHSLIAPDSDILVCIIRSDSIKGGQLKTYIGENSFLNLQDVIDPGKLALVLPPDYKNMPNQELAVYVDIFIHSLFENCPYKRDKVNDERIAMAQYYINLNLGKKIGLDDISDYIHLSAERIRHLFIEELGIPFSKYIIWVRILKTMEAAVADKNKFTGACLLYGFTDISHFNHAFKKIFRQSPRSFIKNTRILL